MKPLKTDKELPYLRVEIQQNDSGFEDIFRCIKRPDLSSSLSEKSKNLRFKQGQIVKLPKKWIEKKKSVAATSSKLPFYIWRLEYFLSKGEFSSPVSEIPDTDVLSHNLILNYDHKFSETNILELSFGLKSMSITISADNEVSASDMAPIGGARYSFYKSNSLTFSGLYRFDRISVSNTTAISGEASQSFIYKNSLGGSVDYDFGNLRASFEACYILPSSNETNNLKSGSEFTPSLTYRMNRFWVGYGYHLMNLTLDSGDSSGSFHELKVAYSF